jgi:hypothetical protein
MDAGSDFTNQTRVVKGGLADIICTAKDAVAVPGNFYAA